MDMMEKDLKSELENIQATVELNNSGESLVDPAITKEAKADATSKSDISEQLDAKKKELICQIFVHLLCCIIA
ncbi:hypothetical protein FRX31_017557 [Thalictrum thalictroides]|uniref:Uncharacterized protein n=1 Tax=Thalictrum thalictroides TaxID=46969 RepID=A0A7J6W667_THATH|nr:hypothetical protein FRX31_017557 [Thalictrum thalictroides]